MISYGPLLKTLNEKHMTFDSFNKKINGGQKFKFTLNTNRYISIQMLDKICSLLEVSVDKVVEWKPGEQPVEQKCQIDWPKFISLIRNKRYTLTSFSIKCHLDPSYISHAKRRNAKLTEKTVDEFCKYLHCDKEDILVKE